MNLDLIDVTKKIGENTILQNVSLKMESGCVYGIQGANGSGKTMLMRLISGMMYPSSGKVEINGKVLGEVMDFPPSIGMLLDGPTYLPEYTGFRNLMLLAEIRGKSTKKDAEEALQRVGLDANDRRRVKAYSLGMKQRLGIAEAILEHPDLILLDEPTNALDEAGTQDICNLITEERKRGALIILSSHNREVLERMSDVLFQIKNKTVVLGESNG